MGLFAGPHYCYALHATAVDRVLYRVMKWTYKGGGGQYVEGVIHRELDIRRSRLSTYIGPFNALTKA